MESADNVTVFQQLAKEMAATQEKIEKLDETVVEFVRLNGAGDGVRKRLRSTLKKTEFVKACESFCKKEV